MKSPLLRIPPILVVCLVVLQVGVCQVQRKTMHIFPFENAVSSQFQGSFKFPQNDSVEFARSLAFKITHSKAIDLHADNVQGRVTPLLRSGLDGERFRFQLDTLCSRDAVDYYMIGRITDDTSNIAFVDAQVYKRPMFVPGDEPLVFDIHAEGSGKEAMRNNVSLDEYLLRQLLSQVEAKVDDRIRVLIVPFAFYGKAQAFEDLGGMISALLRSRLNISQRVRVIVQDTTALKDVRTGNSRNEGFIAWTLPELGRREAANYVITGSYFQQGRSVGVEASHIDVETGHSVLSKSVLVDSVTGRLLYDNVIALGDEMRRAIELDYDSRHNPLKHTIAVVAVPPYPPTSENRSLALDVARTIARKLRAMASANTNLEVLSEESSMVKFVSGNCEKAVMSTEMNARELLIIHCDRPGRAVHLGAELFDSQNPNSPTRWLSQIDVPMETLGHKIDSILLASRKMLLPSVCAGDSLECENHIRDINVPNHPRSIAVVALPPYPSTDENRFFSLSIMHTMAAKLRTLEGEGANLDVVSAESKLGPDYLETELDPDSICTRVRTEYLWTIYLEQGGHDRRVFTKLTNQWNPYDTPRSRTYPVEHLDDLNSTVRTLTTDMLNRWWPELDSNWVTPLDKITTETESGGVRVRGGIIGFIPASADLFLGNMYRYGIEVSGIYYRLPMQYELLADFDFGKQEGDRYVHGRYVTLLFRYNFINISCLANMRLFLGAGISALNVERVRSEVLGRMKMGIAFATGLEVPLTRQFYFDLAGQFTWSLFSDVDPGQFNPVDFPVGRPTYLRLGIGLGYKLRY